MTKTTYKNVTLAGEEDAGSLSLSTKGLIYHPAWEDEPEIKLKWTVITKHQINKESSEKAMLKITTTSQGKSYQFEMKNRSDLVKIKKDIAERKANETLRKSKVYQS